MTKKKSTISKTPAKKSKARGAINLNQSTKIDGETGLTIMELAFCENFVRHLNATKAAIEAGYINSNSTKVIAHELLRKPTVKKYLKDKLEVLRLGADETQKLISDIANGSLNDFMKIVKVLHTPDKIIPLSEYIEIMRKAMDFEEICAERMSLKDKELTQHIAKMEEMRKDIIRLEVELELNPSATRVVRGEPEYIETIEMDFVALAKNKELGRVKTFSKNADGTIKVELCSPDTALTNLARLHGIFEKDNKQKAANITVGYGGADEEED